MGLFNFFRKRDETVTQTDELVNDVLLKAMLKGEKIDKEKAISAKHDIEKITDKNISMSGDAISTAIATEDTETEITKIAIIAIVIIFAILFLTTFALVFEPRISEPFFIVSTFRTSIRTDE